MDQGRDTAAEERAILPLDGRRSRTAPSRGSIARLRAVIGLWLLAVLAWGTAAAAAQNPPHLARFLPEIAAAALVEGADGFGPIRDDLPVAPVLRRGEMIAWAFITSDVVGSTGCSGKPIRVMVAIGPDAVLRGVKLVKHAKPIVLIGIPEARVVRLTEAYRRLDIAAKAAGGGSAHDLAIISGATVTVMVIDDPVVRSSIRVARAAARRARTGDGPRRPA